MPLHRLLARRALALTAALLVARVWFLLHRELNLDEFEHAHATWCVARGLVPYRDFFEHHTPALYLLFAPLFARFAADVDSEAAVRLLLLSRVAMWVITAACVALTYRIGTRVGGRLTGALAALFLATSSQFLNAMLEFRPDVPAVFCVLVAAACATAAVTSGRTRRELLLWCAAGIALGAALTFTQKAALAASGLLLGAAISRWRSCAAAVVGVAIPVLATLWWCHAHQALAPFLYDNVTMNVRLNGDRFSPLPGLLAAVIHQPVPYVLGVAGLITTIRSISSRSDLRMPLMLTTAALLAGIFAVGRVYDQYYAFVLPALAIFAAAFARDFFGGARPRWTTHAALRGLTPVAAAAGVAALIVFVEPRSTAQALIMIACFALMAALAAGAALAWGSHNRASAAMALLALAALSIGNFVRLYEPIAPQLEEIAWVTQHTGPVDTALGGSPGPALFRPHAWFYFFLSGSFITGDDRARLRADLESGRVRPRLVLLDPLLAALPEVAEYTHRHYRPVRGVILERQD